MLQPDFQTSLKKFITKIIMLQPDFQTSLKTIDNKNNYASDNCLPGFVFTDHSQKHSLSKICKFGINATLYWLDCMFQRIKSCVASTF